MKKKGMKNINMRITYHYEKSYKGYYFAKSSTDLIKIICYKFISILKIRRLQRFEEQGFEI